MSSIEFDTGFVKQCMERGLNKYQTDDMQKLATYAKAFESPEFLQGFTEVVGVKRVANMSEVEKAACVKKYFDSLFQDER